MCKYFMENKKLYYKEVKKMRGGRKTLSERIKDKGGRLLKRDEDVRGRWREHFEEVMGGESEGRVTITSFGMGGKVGE